MPEVYVFISGNVDNQFGRSDLRPKAQRVKRLLLSVQIENVRISTHGNGTQHSLVLALGVRLLH